MDDVILKDIDNSKNKTHSNENRIHISELRIKRKIFAIIIVGIILLMVGLGVFIFKLEPILNSMTPRELQDDWDNETESYKSFEISDKLVIFGKIIEVIQTKNFEDNEDNRTEEILTLKYGGKFIFIIDNDLQIFSNKDLGNNGDYIIVECEIVEVEDPDEATVQQILKARSYENPIPLLVLSVIILFIGCTILILGLRKRKKFVKETSETYKLSKLYLDTGTKNEEDELYRYLHGKTKKEKTTQIKKIDERPSIDTTLNKRIAIKKPKDSLYVRHDTSKGHIRSTNKTSKKHLKDYEEDYQLIKKVYSSIDSRNSKKYKKP